MTQLISFFVFFAVIIPHAARVSYRIFRCKKIEKTEPTKEDNFFFKIYHFLFLVLAMFLILLSPITSYFIAFFAKDLILYLEVIAPPIGTLMERQTAFFFLGIILFAYSMKLALNFSINFIVDLIANRIDESRKI